MSTGENEGPNNPFLILTEGGNVGSDSLDKNLADSEQEDSTRQNSSSKQFVGYVIVGDKTVPGLIVDVSINAPPEAQADAISRRTDKIYSAVRMAVGLIYQPSHEVSGEDLEEKAPEEFISDGQLSQDEELPDEQMQALQLDPDTDYPTIEREIDWPG